MQGACLALPKAVLSIGPPSSPLQLIPRKEMSGRPLAVGRPVAIHLIVLEMEHVYAPPTRMLFKGTWTGNVSEAGLRIGMII